MDTGRAWLLLIYIFINQHEKQVYYHTQTHTRNLHSTDHYILPSTGWQLPVLLSPRQVLTALLPASFSAPNCQLQSPPSNLFSLMEISLTLSRQYIWMRAMSMPAQRSVHLPSWQPSTSSSSSQLWIRRSLRKNSNAQSILSERILTIAVERQFLP
jgi:hypothetical protein